jgi:hypothetical protein
MSHFGANNTDNGNRQIYLFPAKLLDITCFAGLMRFSGNTLILT